jgi:hypothetical protein
LARISFFDSSGNPLLTELPNASGQTSNSNFLTLPGYSPKAIIVSIVLGVCLTGGVAGMGFRTFGGKKGELMPLVGNDSWAIAAACHKKNGESIAYRRVGWGMLSIYEDGTGHCGFSADEVGTLEVGNRYA